MSASMYHLDIAKIVQVIDDYFLLFDSDSATSVKAKKCSSAHVDGLTICRNLKNGWIEVVIYHVRSDEESIAVKYHKNGSNNDHDGYESLDPEDLSSESISSAIRQMILYDRQVRNPKDSDAVLSPNN